MFKLGSLIRAFNRLNCGVTSNCIKGKVNVNPNPCVTIVRETNFFNKLPAEAIWKGVTSVSNPGRKRGRGKGAKKLMRNLNKGQIIGVGKENIQWPGLTTPVIQGKEIVRQQKLPPDPDRDARLSKLRDSQSNFRMTRLTPLERGWCGNKLPGRSIGPPDPVGDVNFEGFDTRVLELKSVFCMRKTVGRFRRVSVVAVTGNENGVAGFALGKAVDGKTAVRKAKNRAGTKLMYIERYNNHTVLHDFFSQFGRTKVFVEKKPEGYGLKCHRAIKTICQVVGIKDLRAKVENSTNLQHIVKAFFLGLVRQKTHQQLADEMNLHLVEFRKENDFCPRIIASPANGCNESIDQTQIPDFTSYIMNDRVVLRKKKLPPFYSEYNSYKVKRRIIEKRRNHDVARLTLLAEYGEIRSFLSDKYPECKIELKSRLHIKPPQHSSS